MLRTGWIMAWTTEQVKQCRRADRRLYLDADLEIVAASVGQAIDDYAAYVRAIAAWLSAQATDSDTSG